MSAVLDKLEAVAVIGSSEASVERCRAAIQTLKQSDIHNHQMLSMFRYSKVQPQAYTHLLRSGEYEGTSLLNELHEEYQLCVKRMSWMKQMLNLIDQIAAEQNIHPILIKGAAVNKWYPGEQIRFSKDVDVLLPDARELWTLTAQLRANGCEQKEAWYFSKRNDKAEPYFITGHWNKKFADGDFRLDLHAGFYSTLFLQKLKIPELDEACMPVPDMKNLRQFRPEVSMILLLGHALSHQGITIRDINDAYCIFECFPDMDMDMVRHYIRLNALEFVANDLEYWLNRVYVEENSSRFRVTGAGLPPTPAAQWPLHYSWRKIARQWWNLERIEVGRAGSLREVAVLGWGNFFAKYLANMQTRKYRPTECILQKISSFRHAYVEFGYMSCPALLENMEVPYQLDVEDQPLLNALHQAGVAAVWNDSLHGIKASFEEGELLLTPCGIFIISDNLLFTEEMIERSQEILHIIR